MWGFLIVCFYFYLAWQAWRTLTTIYCILDHLSFSYFGCLQTHRIQGHEAVHPRAHSNIYPISLRAHLPVIPLQGTMRFLRPSILLASILQASQLALAFHIEHPSRSEAALPNLLSRAPNATSGLDNVGGSYYVNITLGGKRFSVLIDTGR